jgi:hypothetical protein
MNAYRSLAKHGGVDLHDMLQAPKHDALGDLLLETRIAGDATSRRDGISPRVAYQTLYREKPLSILLDRHVRA